MNFSPEFFKGFDMMNSYSPYVCIFDQEVLRASKMTIQQLQWAIADCKECIKIGVNTSKYMDQLSVYRQEVMKQELAKENRPKR